MANKLGMKECIKCGIETPHSICGKCAHELVSKMTPEDRLAHALVGLDVRDGKTNLRKRLEDYKKMSFTQLNSSFLARKLGRVT